MQIQIEIDHKPLFSCIAELRAIELLDLITER